MRLSDSWEALFGRAPFPILVPANGVVQHDFMLMDCQMPEKDGSAAAREIRRLDSEGRHPIIDDYTAKPVKLQLLSAALRTLTLKVNPRL